MYLPIHPWSQYKYEYCTSNLTVLVVYSVETQYIQVLPPVYIIRTSTLQYMLSTSIQYTCTGMPLSVLYSTCTVGRYVRTSRATRFNYSYTVPVLSTSTSISYRSLQYWHTDTQTHIHTCVRMCIQIHKRTLSRCMQSFAFFCNFFDLCLLYCIQTKLWLF